jgi:hypothetical protein
MMKLDAITLDFARQVIEEETGTPLEIEARAAHIPESAAAAAGEARLVARDDKKNPLISTFEWTADAAQRILRVPAGFMRNKTPDARERASSTIDLALVEEGIEIGRKMMAEMIANYPSSPSSPPARHNLNLARHDSRKREHSASRRRLCTWHRSQASPKRSLLPARQARDGTGAAPIARPTPLSVLRLSRCSK